jgi:hypothetical protein
MQVVWRGFLRALADEVDASAGVTARDTLLRAVGHRMARMMPLPPASSLETLEIEMNDALELCGWGAVRLDLQESDRYLVLHHSGLPRLGSLGDPPGTWLAAVLEGLYEGWMGQQPGSEPSLSARVQPHHDGSDIILRYGRV